MIVLMGYVKTSLSFQLIHPEICTTLHSSSWKVLQFRSMPMRFLGSYSVYKKILNGQARYSARGLLSNKNTVLVTQRHGFVETILTGDIFLHPLSKVNLALRKLRHPCLVSGVVQVMAPRRRILPVYLREHRHAQAAFTHTRTHPHALRPSYASAETWPTTT